jgi:hypothetical protein
MNLTASMGGDEFLAITGTASVDAGAGAFCEMQSILASFSPTR